MCGIAGFFEKSRNNHHAPVGQVLLSMLEGLACRGPDSTGVALLAPGTDQRVVLRINLGENGEAPARLAALRNFLDRKFKSRYELTSHANAARLVVSEATDAQALAAGIEALDKKFEVVSIGECLEIVKQVGSPANLDRAYGVAQMKGTHGIGHTRLSTESKVDLSHSQPFGSHQIGDLAIVHNGHITNYHQLRRRFEQHRIRFYTENDSEVVAIYLADQISKGLTLREALHAMLGDLDGSFSCLVATANQIGFVKDPFALKPLLWAETESFVALANEEVAIRSALPGAYDVREAQAREVRLWER